MSGLLRRLTRRRPAPTDETGFPTPASSEPAGAPAPTAAGPGGRDPVPADDTSGGGHAMPVGDEQATKVLPATGDTRAAADQPTVIEGEQAGTTPGRPAVIAAEPAARTPDQATVIAAEPAARTPDQATVIEAEQAGREPDRPTVLGAGQTVERSVVAAEPSAPIPHPAPVRDLPAGIDPSELASAPVASAPRGKLRRRLRYLRRVRELLLRDLGGFMYEIQRTAGGTPQESHRRLLEGKTNRIAALDAEVRGLETRLAEPHAEPALREPGIGGTCPECGELHASDAHYCSRCGAPLDAKARARRDAAVAAAVHQTTASHPTAEPAPASVLWAAGPRPVRSAAEPDDEEERSHPLPATSQWLALPHRQREVAVTSTAEEPAVVEPGRREGGEPAAVDQPASSADEPAAVGDAPRLGDDAATGEPTGDEIGDDAARETAASDDTGGDAAREAAAGDEPDDEAAARGSAAGDEPGYEGAARGSAARDEPGDDAATPEAAAGDEAARPAAAPREQMVGEQPVREPEAGDDTGGAAAVRDPADEEPATAHQTATGEAGIGIPERATGGATAGEGDARAADGEPQAAEPDARAADGEPGAAEPDARAADSEPQAAEGDAGAAEGEAGASESKRGSEAERPGANAPEPEFDPGPNGQRDAQVRPPVSPGDRLTTRRQRP